MSASQIEIIQYMNLSCDLCQQAAGNRTRENGLPNAEYDDWLHVVNVVTLENGERHIQDVSFGGDGAVIPLPLFEETITRNLMPQEIRAIHDCLPGQSTICKRSKPTVTAMC